jgi:hypothetical protein
MALPTGSGTETLHSHLFEDVDGTQILIKGVQHHVYTVLSIIVYCNALNATADFGYIIMKGYDNHGGASAQEPNIARFNIQVGETFVWNDKFSFNGFEPSGTDVFSTAAHQTANAAQAGSVAQELKFAMTSSGDDFDITVTYIDQDNS